MPPSKPKRKWKWDGSMYTEVQVRRRVKEGGGGNHRCQSSEDIYAHMSGKFENLNCCLMKRNEPDHDRCNMVPPIMLFRLRAQGRPPFGRITTIARLIAAMWYRRRRAAARREPADPVRRKSSTPRVQMLRVGPLSNRRACDIKLSKTTPSAS